MRELVEQIDAHAEPEDIEATSIPSTQDHLSIDPLFSVADQQQTKLDPQHNPLAEPISTVSLSFSFLLNFCYSLLFIW